MKAKRLERKLVGYHCTDCGGHWICSRDYHDWLEIRDGGLEDRNEPDLSLRPDDISRAKLCPECRRIMTKYKVGHGLTFKVDVCGSCNGFWLDHNEWEILRSKNLHHEINRIFTKSWQKQISDQENRAKLTQVIQNRIGEDAFRRADDFKQWLDNQEEKDMILAYLRNW